MRIALSNQHTQEIVEHGHAALRAGVAAPRCYQQQPKVMSSILKLAAWVRLVLGRLGRYPDGVQGRCGVQAVAWILS